jgi:hypothetical protein
MKTTAILINTKSWDKTLFFVLLCALSGVMTYAAQSLLITDDLYFSFFGDQLSYDRISEIINFSRKWQWLSYAVIPFYYLMKMFMVSTCIYTGTIIAGPEISFTRIFQVALLGESIFLIPLILKLCWFLWVQPDYTLADIHSFYPLSALNLFDRESLDSWLLYPLQAMNLFEVLYFLALAYGLYLITKVSYINMLALVVCTYGTGLFIWMISIMFLTVTFTS